MHRDRKGFREPGDPISSAEAFIFLFHGRSFQSGHDTGSNSPLINWIVVKGICDYADEQQIGDAKANRGLPVEMRRGSSWGHFDRGIRSRLGV